MATGTATNSKAPTSPEGAVAASYVDRQLARTGRHVKVVDLLGAGMLYVTAAAAFFMVAVVIDHWMFGLGTLGRTLAFLVFFGGSVWFLAAQIWIAWRRINPVYAARVIEQSAPSLKNSLVNMLLFRSNGTPLQEMLFDALRQKAAADLNTVPPETAVDRSRLIKLGYLLVGALVVCAGYKILSPKDPLQTVSRVIAPWASIQRPSRVNIREVTPGTVSVFHGQQVKVTAKVETHGLGATGPVLLWFSTTDGRAVDQQLTMSPLALGEFEAILPPGPGGVRQDLKYHVSVEDAISAEYRLTVLPAPTILIERMVLDFPSYTARPSETQERQGDIRAIEGTRVTVHAKASEPIQSAHLEFDPADGKESSKEKGKATAAANRTARLPMQANGESATSVFVLELAADRQSAKYSSYQARFVTEKGIRSEQPVLHQIQVLPDLAPEIEILTPALDRMDVPENGRQKIELRAIDPDFGLSNVTLRAVSGNTDVLTQVLLKDSRGRAGQNVLTFDFVPRDLHLEAGDEVRFWGVAEDNRTNAKTGLPDPNTQRTREYNLRIVGAQDNGNANSQENNADKNSPEKTDPTNGQPENPNGQQPANSKNANGGNEQGNNGQDNSGKPQGNEGGKGKPDQGKNSSGQPQQGNQSNQPNQGNNSSGGNSGQQKNGSPNGGSKSNGQGNSPSGNSPDGGEKNPNASPQSNGNNTPQKNPGGANTGAEKSNDSTGSAGQEKPSDPGVKPTGTANDSTTKGTPTGDSQPRDNNDPRGASGENGGQKSPSQSRDAKPTEKLHDGEVIERALEHLKEQQAKEKSEAKANNKESGAESQPSNNGSGNPNAADKQQPHSKENGAAGAQPKSNEPQSPNAAKKNPNVKPNGGGASENNSGAENKTGPSKENGPSGAGNAQQKNAGDAETKNKDPQQGQNSDARGAKPNTSDDAKSSSQNKKEADSAQHSDGVQQKGQKKGGGQGANQQSNDSSGSKSSADEGAGQSSDRGQGETSNKGGDKKQAEQPTGAAGNEKGNGSQSKSGEGSSEGGSPSDKNASNKQGATSSTPGKGGGVPKGGGAASNNPSQISGAAGQVPDGDAANLDHARKATDLVLDYLKNQKDNPDRELLDKLGWSEADMKQFVERWQAMKRDAADPTKKEASRDLDESLRSLGLRSQTDRIRSGSTARDAQRGNRDSGARSAPPAGYADQFNAFRKGTARAKDE